MAGTSCRTTPSACLRRRATTAGARRCSRRNSSMRCKILEEGHVKLADMRSSWGGAMGLTQFLPSEFYKHGIDFDGDGRRNIWTSVPDALASAAQAARRQGLEARHALGLRSARAGQCRLHHRRAGAHAAGQRMARARLCADPRPPAESAGARRAGLAPAAGRHLRAGLPDAEELLRDQGVQFLRSLRAVRRAL